MRRIIRFFSWWGLRMDSKDIPPPYRHKPERITARTAWLMSKEF